MKLITRAFRYVLGFGIVVGVLVFVFTNWSWVFSKRVSGEILEVERVTAPTAVFGKATDAQIHSYSVLIKGEDGRLYSSSSEDRQWQVAKKGYCVEALFYRYPPWEFKQGNTFFNARVEELRLCPGKAPPPPEAPVEAAPAEATPPVGGTPPQGGIQAGGTAVIGAAGGVVLQPARVSVPAKPPVPPPSTGRVKKTQPVPPPER